MIRIIHDNNTCLFELVDLNQIFSSQLMDSHKNIKKENILFLFYTFIHSFTTCTVLKQHDSGSITNNRSVVSVFIPI